MKTILCYGDSNTYGFDPETGDRYDYDTRWTGKLQHFLGPDYRVIEEGLNSRTTVLNDPCYEDNKNGLALLPAVLKSHMPLDLVIIMLGSNDLKNRFHMEAAEIARGAALLISTTKHILASKGQSAEILLVAPPPVTEDLLTGPCGCEFGERALRVSSELSYWYARVAASNGAHFFDAYSLVKPSELDGLHLTKKAHALLARKLLEKCMDILD